MPPTMNVIRGKIISATVTLELTAGDLTVTNSLIAFIIELSSIPMPFFLSPLPLLLFLCSVRGGGQEKG